jgi:hypothetical protein
MVNAFSFCLFGSVGAINGRVENDGGLVTTHVCCIPGGYYDGLEENIKLIEKHFPGWRVYVYLADDVPEWFETFLCTTYPSVTSRRTGTLGYETTVHRFFAADEPDVDVVFFRDADSRVHWRDRWTIQTFLSQSESLAHIVRDHPQHTSRIAAGMWGVRKGLLKTPLRTLYASWEPVHSGSGDVSDVMGYGIDQNFLESVVYQLLKPSVLITHSNGSVVYGERGVEIPFPWSTEMHVGRVETKTITDNFWTRERDTPPPLLWQVVIPPPFTPPVIAPPQVQVSGPRNFVWHRLMNPRAPAV